MLNGPKHCWNPHDGTFIMFFYFSEGNKVVKILPKWYLKSLDCLLVYWLSMTSILFIIVRIYDNHLKCNYLRNNFLIFCFISEIYINLSTLWKKRMYFRNYGLRKTGLNKRLKSLVSEHLSTVNMQMCTKHYWKSHFYYIFLSLPVKWCWKM